MRSKLGIVLGHCGRDVGVREAGLRDVDAGVIKGDFRSQA